MMSATKVPESVQDRRPDESVVPASSDIDIENQFDRWKAFQPAIEYELSVNPKGSFYWYWSCLVSIAVFYNLIFITLLAFDDVRNGSYVHWFVGNIICDMIYFVDMWFQSRISFYENGCKVTNISETRSNYFSKSRFLMDVVALIPTDLLLLLQLNNSLIRMNRLFKCYRIIEIFELAQGRFKQSAISLLKIIISCALIFHWNACAFYMISSFSDTKSWDEVNATFDDDDSWPWPYMPDKITDVYFADCSHFENTCYDQQIFLDEEREMHLFDLWRYWQNRTTRIEFSTFTKSYVLSMYWSALTITTLGEQPSPNESMQSVFEILDTVIGMLLFAGIVGSIADMVAKANKVKTDWQQRMDGLKQFMAYRNLHTEFQRRVLKYCEYEMSKRENMSELEMRDCLPPKLYTQVNRFAQWTVLTKSPLFENCEVPFLKDVVGYLEPRDFGPDEVVCARGELSREMFVVASGCLKSVDHYNTTLKTFRAGDVVEDRSLFWFPNHRYQNRKMYDVVSTGYSQVYILFRDNFLRVLADYPQYRKSLQNKAELMQREADELLDDGVKLDVVEFEGTTLEERLLAIRSVLAALESSVDVNYEKFKKTTRSFKYRLTALERFCREYNTCL